MAEQTNPQRVVYTLPTMEQVSVTKDLVYKQVDDAALKLDAYYPVDMLEGTKRPAVLFVHGESAYNTPTNLKDSGQYTDWGKLVVASGLIGVTFNHRASQQYTRIADPAGDIADLVEYVRTQVAGVDGERLCIWVCSGGGASGLTVALRDTPAYIRCIISYYAVMDLLIYDNQFPPEVSLEQLQEYSPKAYLSRQPEAIAPILIARAGLDKGINLSIDAFVQEALEQNVTFELINYPQGHHGFDVFDDTTESRTIIKRTLAFMQHYLLV